MYAPRPADPAVQSRCVQTPCSTRTKADTLVFGFEGPGLDALGMPSILDSPAPEPDSPCKARLDFQSVRIYNKLVHFRFDCDSARTAMAFRIPTFYSEPKNLSFFKVTSPASFNFVSSARCEFGAITEADLRGATAAVNVRLRPANDLQVNRRLREKRFDIFQKSDAKKIRKFVQRTRQFAVGRTEDHSEAGAARFPPQLFPPVRRPSNDDWRTKSHPPRTQGSVVGERLGSELRVGGGRISEFKFARAGLPNADSPASRNVFFQDLGNDATRLCPELTAVFPARVAPLDASRPAPLARS